MIPGSPRAAGVYIGQAKVLASEPDGRPRVLVLGGALDTTVADWAIPFRYEPVAGDLLLVMGQNGRYWVTGVVHGTGRSQLAFRGDTEIRATDGSLQLSGDDGVRIQAPQVRVEADELTTETSDTHQRFEDVDSEVTGTLDERAGESMRDIDGEDSVTAARSETVATHVAKVDGGLLRLS